MIPRVSSKGQLLQASSMALDKRLRLPGVFQMLAHHVGFCNPCLDSVVEKGASDVACALSSLPLDAPGLLMTFESQGSVRFKHILFF